MAKCPKCGVNNSEQQWNFRLLRKEWQCIRCKTRWIYRYGREFIVSDKDYFERLSFDDFMKVVKGEKCREIEI